MASLQREDGASGNEVPRTHLFVTCSLNQAFVLSAPTPVRLSEILESWLQTGTIPVPQGYHTRQQSGYAIQTSGSDGAQFLWGILDPVLDAGVANGGVRPPDSYQELVASIRSQWPTSFGHVEKHPDGTPSGFRWDNTYPELLGAAYYPLAPQGQPKTSVIFRGPVKTRLPYRPDSKIAPSTTVPETPHTLNLELASHGRIWYDCQVIRNN